MKLLWGKRELCSYKSQVVKCTFDTCVNNEEQKSFVWKRVTDPGKLTQLIADCHGDLLTLLMRQGTDHFYQVSDALDSVD